MPASIFQKCNNPQATITLKDANDNILDQREFSFETKTKESKTFFIIFGILVVAGIIYFINLRKKENETKV